MEAKISKIKAYRGLCVAPFTPFDGKGNININLIDEYVSLLQKQSVTGAFGTFMTALQKDVLWQATHAESLNVDAISVLPPFYFRSPSIDHLIRYVQEVAKAAPNTPIIYYHIPAFTFVNVRMTEFLPEAKRRVPALCGAKYSCSELSDLAGFLRADKADIKIFFGYEEDKLKHGIDTLCNHGFSVAALKAAANKVSGLNFGDTRMPVCPLSDDQAEKLAEEIRALDILI
ncbi:hypothetical protein HPB50_006566 [Hyalomma asiaticum]|uniref:Uncharacterized protein n=1 Tax=Hyalomma asiaticum TaxID=266040 RepID=A0ACB7SY24_HYAAI|nr:hypothetical protein HPB50_006566 [Hyalomma asiaticum]